MTLSAQDEEELLAIAVKAARDAAAILEPGWRKHPTAFHKGKVDLVTEFDRASERFLREALAPTGIPFVGEEMGGERAKGEDAPTWYVDPLDGTTNFVHGHPFYCVSIGLVVGQKARLGVVNAPALRCEWQARVGDKALRNGDICTVSETAELGDALLATGFPYDRMTSEDNNFDAFVAMKRRAQAVRRCGSAALDLCFVGDGTYDGYWEKKLKPWDIAGGIAVVLAASGHVSSFAGTHCDPALGQVVASNRLVHAEILKVICPA